MGKDHNSAIMDVRLEIADRLLRLRKPSFSPKQVAELTSLEETKVLRLTSWLKKKIFVHKIPNDLNKYNLLNHFRKFGKIEKEIILEQHNCAYFTP
eukprot:UN02360